MKIISGKHRSRIIKYIKSSTTRPTSNMVREGVFNMLNDVIDQIVLDLFAGSGSYGLEALSRGAKHVYFNDVDRKNTKIIQENLEYLNELSNATIHILDYRNALKYYEKNGITFDLIFLDPPYFENIYEKVIPLVIRLLNSSGKIIIEIDKNISVDLENHKVEILKDRIYGNKKILIVKNVK